MNHHAKTQPALTMKTHIQNLPKLARLVALVLLSTLNPQPSTFAQGTAFTYQGRLADNGTPANGVVELQCTLWNALSGGTQVATATPATTVVTVTNGLFTMPLDFGTAAFDGSDRYLQIEARSTIGPFSLLTPRQKITATPYALLAGKLSGTVASSGLGGTYGNVMTFSNAANVFNGTFTGNGSGLSNLNAASLGGLSASNFWKLGGNAGTTASVNFLGTTDNQPLELKANGQRTLRLEPIFTVTNRVLGGSLIFSNAPNVIGGSAGNSADAGVAGAFIGGGGFGGAYGDEGAGYVFLGAFSNRISSSLGTIGGGYFNTIQSNSLASTIGGGAGNTIQTGSESGVIGGGTLNNIQTRAFYSTIGGGSVNGIDTNASFSTIAGGSGNSIRSNGTYSAIGGGDGNSIRENSEHSTISGGNGNTVLARFATIPGGSDNNAAGDYSFAAGRRASALSQGTFVWADSTDAEFTSTANNQFLIRAGGGVGIGSTVTPNGALHLRSGGLAVTGGSSPYYGTPPGVYIEGNSAVGHVYAFNYASFTPLPLVLDTGGGHVGIGRTPTANALEVSGNASKTTAGDWLANSDARIKTDIKPVQDALSALEKVRLVSFRYNDDYRATHRGVEDRRYLNVVAQEFREVFPEHVKSSGEKLPNGDEILQVDTYPLTIYSAAAIQELNHKLNAELKARDGRIEALEKRLAELEKLMNRATTAQTGGAK
jgi:hypothetical protein